MAYWIFITATIVILMTSGPTHTLLAAARIQRSVAQSLKLVPAEAPGYVFAIPIWGLPIGFIAQYAALILHLVKRACAVYIAYGYQTVVVFRCCRRSCPLHQRTGSFTTTNIAKFA